MYVKLTLGKMFNTQSFIYCLKKAIRNSYLITNSKTKVAFRISNEEFDDAIQYDIDGFRVWQRYCWATPRQAIDAIVDNIEKEVKLANA